MLRPWRRLYRRFNGATSARSWKCRGHRGAALQTMRASMGPRARARGNPNHSGAGHSRDVLQWGHERALVEIGRSPFRGGRRTALQWGHERALVEMMFVNAPLTWSVELQWGHERALVEIRPIRPPRAAILGFNGATSARSWKWSEVGACGLLWFGLQWGH